jgi:hypothetical protein
MTMEPVEPTAPQQANPNPMFRRRRRKRKGPPNGQPSQPGAVQSAQPGGASEAQGQSSGMEPVPVQQPAGQFRSNGSGQQQRTGKKRFFKKKQFKSANPGNGQPQQQRRNNRQGRQPRTFVGPMDHSYRAANGNFADAPPSTVELQRSNSNGNGNGGHANGYHASGYEDVHEFPAAPGNGAAADAPTRIYCFIEDLFFLAKIQETARKLGVKVVFVKNDKDTLERLTDAPENERPALIVFDLNNANAKPLTLIPKLKSKLKRSTSVIGFLSHLQGDLKVKAAEAGCDAVMPRSAFSQNLPNLLRRYGTDENEAEYAEA